MRSWRCMLKWLVGMRPVALQAEMRGSLPHRSMRRVIVSVTFWRSASLNMDTSWKLGVTSDTRLHAQGDRFDMRRCEGPNLACMLHTAVGISRERGDACLLQHAGTDPGECSCSVPMCLDPLTQVCPCRPWWWCAHSVLLFGYFRSLKTKPVSAHSTSRCFCSSAAYLCWAAGISRWASSDTDLDAITRAP